MTLYILVSLESRAGIAVAPAAAPRLFTKIKRQRGGAGSWRVCAVGPRPAALPRPRLCVTFTQRNRTPDLHRGSRTRLTQPDCEYTARRLDSRRVGPKRHGAHTTLHRTTFACGPAQRTGAREGTIASLPCPHAVRHRLRSVGAIRPFARIRMHATQDAAPRALLPRRPHGFTSHVRHGHAAITTAHLSLTGRRGDLASRQYSEHRRLRGRGAGWCHLREI